MLAPDDEEGVLSLVTDLNSILGKLNIPLKLDSPAELTPSLLLAILERLIGQSIPLNEHLKRSLKRPERNEKQHARIQVTKLFLGVLLDCELLKSDVGLTDIDPRRLANGEWEEVSFIGELLVWMAKKAGVLVKTRRKKKPRDRGRHYGSDNGSNRPGSRASRRSITPMNTFQQGLEQAVPVRYDGYINVADEESELESFEASRSMLSDLRVGSPLADDEEVSLTRMRLDVLLSSPSERCQDTTQIRNHDQLCKRTLALLQERARLLNELARLDIH